MVSLKKVAVFPVGTFVNSDILFSDDSIRALVIREFHGILPEVDMSMDQVVSQPDSYNWSAIDSLTTFSRLHNLRITGRALVSNSGVPKWLVEAGHDSTSLAAFLDMYVATFINRYKEVVHGWDVVSEAVSAGDGSPHASFWHEVLGESYIDNAFIAAHKVAPDAVLFLNERIGGQDTLRLNAVIERIDKLKSRGIPVSGISLEMHLDIDDPLEIIARMLSQAANTGLQVHLSGLHISSSLQQTDRKLGEFTSELADKQGEMYRHVAELYRNIVPENQQYGITVKGFAGKTANDRKATLSGWPALFDAELRRKPAYYGFLNGVSED